MRRLPEEKPEEKPDEKPGEKLKEKQPGESAAGVLGQVPERSVAGP
jgi:hypothetical protein